MLNGPNLRHRLGTGRSCQRILWVPKLINKLDFAIVSEGTSDYAKRLDGARAFIAETGIELGHEAIQLHGAMGITQELSIGQGHKRLMVLSRWPEAPDAALDRFALAS